MRRLDLALVVGVFLVTILLGSLLVLTATPRKIVGTSLSEAKVESTERSGQKEIAIDLTPTIIRTIKVIRDGQVIYENTKVGDPFTVHWYRLVANWLLGLYYWSGYQQPVIA